ncbi:hypothetical protein PR202_gb27949 [Eleusine coracana subsp. coracana]|uniref:Glycosyltransferase 2-like domain-containing protein n=1 Tax=Eleusine coracana subsp. coracana TaxID=191504 RepID=A0AAV5FVS3_ELECO|nr:hypothetical protein PR202_gb27949 [Eleusine coracana subsp. coracana]
MSLDYHFTVEQEVGSATHAFFGFNGTAGIWRISALNEAGGWKDRTTVEDMDLAVRASLKGWKFVFLGDLMLSPSKRCTRKHIANTKFLVPEVEIPRWGSVYIPTIITLINGIGSPRLHVLELGVGAYLFFCGCYDFAFGNNNYFLFLFVQSIAFFVVGVGYIGTFVPQS